MKIAGKDRNLIFTMILLYRVKDYRTKNEVSKYGILNKVDDTVILTTSNRYVTLCQLWFNELIWINSMIFRFSGKVKAVLLKVADEIEEGVSIPDLLEKRYVSKIQPLWASV